MSVHHVLYNCVEATQARTTRSLQGIALQKMFIRDKGSSRKSKGLTSCKGIKWEGVMEKEVILAFKSPYLGNSARYDQDYYWSLYKVLYEPSNGTQINDLGWPWTIIMHFSLLYMYFQSQCATIVIWSTM